MNRTRMVVATALTLGIFCALGCDKGAATPAPSSSAPASAEPTAPPPAATTTPAPTASTTVPAQATGSASPAPTGSSAPRSLPPIETVCATDADCVLTSTTLVDAPPQYACCPGCTNHAGNTTWKKKFDAACAATPPPMCPPIGCAMPIQKAACVAKKCVVK